MKKFIHIFFCFVAYISFAQTNKDSIEVTILESGNTHIKSFYYEGVIFNWNENDTLNWNPTIDEIEIVETYIKNLFEKNAIKNIDFYGIDYRELTNYKRQYLGKFRSDQYKEISITFLKGPYLKNNKWLYSSYDGWTSASPLFISLTVKYSDIINNDFSGDY